MTSSPEEPLEATPPAKAKTPQTPRRTAAIKRNNGSTPRQKATTQVKGTPKSAPAKPGTQKGKKPEPTLLGDFLLGRPSPNRVPLHAQRRKSLDAVKAEMKVAAVSKLPQPGGVKDRVTKWQKASAAAATKPEPEYPATEPDELLSEGMDTAGEEERLRIRRKGTKPTKDSKTDKRNPPEKAEGPPDEKTTEEVDTMPANPKIKLSPKKRVVSDDHWMQKKSKKKTPPRKSPIGIEAISSSILLDKAVRIPKDFVQKNSETPPLVDKIAGWAQNLESPVRKESKRKSEPTDVGEGQSKKNDLPFSDKIASWAESIELPTAKTSKMRESSKDIGDNSGSDPGKAKAFSRDIQDDGIRIKPTIEKPLEDGVRITADPSILYDDGVRVTPDRSEQKDRIRVNRVRGSNGRKSHNEVAAERSTPRKDSARGARLTSVEEGPHISGFPSSKEENEAQDPATPTHQPRKPRKSVSPEADSLAEVRVGYSAFSVLDMPVGADAHTLRDTLRKPQPKPVRNSSFKAVPKVLKNMFNEGIKMAQDTVGTEPPRVGINQPPSIESWLNSTTDPFIDKDAPTANQNLPRNDDIQSNDDTMTESYLTTAYTESTRRVSDSTMAKDYEEENRPPTYPKDSTIPRVKNDTDKGVSPSSPMGLKRSTATRSPTAPPTRRRIPLRERLAEAFRGESVHVREFASPADDMFGSMHRNEQENELRRPEPKETYDDAPQVPRHKSSQANLSSSDSLKSSAPEPVKASDHAYTLRREAPMTGKHRLSTIASVETFNSGSSITETSISSLTDSSSMMSDTTITRNTHSSHTSQIEAAKSGIARGSSKSSNKSGLKRRLTKHSDLLSVLSLPDGVPERRGSIRSARSIRTTRINLEDASIDDLLHELADDELKYMRELRTLVDGVIPVLLTCVLSKSSAAIAAGLFDPNAATESDSMITKPIVDMGVALERLKSLHRRIPIQNPQHLVTWAASAHKVYEDYLTAWRMGFKDVVVNLAPASKAPSPEHAALLEEIPHDATGDVVDADGDRVDVAFLLKRPLVRIKQLAKITKGINMLLPTADTIHLKELYEDLLVKTRRRAKEEEARQEDLAANNTDSSRVRDPATLAPIESISINRTRQVYMKDFFTFDLQHSSGQRVDCRVEILLRDKPKDKHDSGDVLICEVDTNSRWLLFPPVDLNRISARSGYEERSVVVQIRGGDDEGHGWHELFTLTAEDEKTASEWIEALGSSPIPPPLQNPQQRTSALVRQQSILSIRKQALDTSDIGDGLSDVEIPIGERRKSPSRPTSSYALTTLKDRIMANKLARDQVFDDLRSSTRPSYEHKMSGGLGEDIEKRARPSRYHSKQVVSTPAAHLNSTMNDDTKLTLQDGTHNREGSTTPTQTHASALLPSKSLNHTKRRPVSVSTSTVFDETKSSPSVDNSKNPLTSTSKTMSLASPPKTPTQEEIPPPPPVHMSPVSSLNQKKTPVLQATTKHSTTRRSSSPLKHEYQPSVLSDTSESESSDDYSDTFTESSDEEELEAPELSMPLPSAGIIYGKPSRPNSIYSMENESLAPSNSASQGPYHKAIITPGRPKVRLVATISAWSDKGRWENLNPNDCSIVIGPGVIEAFLLNTSRGTDGSMSSSNPSDRSQRDDDIERPLVALDLTPLVPLRQSTLVDIEIRSPPLARSFFKWSGSIRFRTHSVEDCNKLYAAIHRARLDNPVFKRLEQERLINSYGGQTYHEVQGSKRRMSFFGRKRSYRATERAPSLSTSDSQTSTSFTSAFMKRITSGNSFNIAKSTIVTQEGSRRTSPATSLYTDSASGYTPPRTPAMSESLAESRNTSMTNIMARGTRDIKIRCYKLVTMSSWGLDISARLTIEDPPKGMRQASTLYSGIEKRILVTAKVPRSKADRLKASEPGEYNSNSAPESRRTSFGGGHSRRISLNGVLGSPKEEKLDDSDQEYYTVLDTVIGGHCVLRYGRTGIAINVWEDLVGPNGEIGGVGAIGGVSGRTRKWMFHFSSQEEMRWIYAVLGGR